MTTATITPPPQAQSQKEIKKPVQRGLEADWELKSYGEFEESSEKKATAAENPFNLPKYDINQQIGFEPIESIKFNEKTSEVANTTSQDSAPNSDSSSTTESSPSFDLVSEAGKVAEAAFEKWIIPGAPILKESLGTATELLTNDILGLGEKKEAPKTQEEQEAAQKAQADFALLRNSAASLLQEESTIKQRTVEEIVNDLFKLDVSTDEVLGKLSPNDVKKGQLDLALFGKSDIGLVVTDIKGSREEAVEAMKGPAIAGKGVFGNEAGDLFQGIENPNAPTKAVG